MNQKIILSAVLVIVLIVGIYLGSNVIKEDIKIRDIKVDLTELKMDNENLKIYTQDDFYKFLSDYKNKKLPAVYVTEFIFDGVDMYRPYDIDDYIKNGNSYKTKVLSIKAININTPGNIEFTGEFTGTILVNTNKLKGDINLILSGVIIDTDTKKAPAIYVYNKDINYTKHKVTIKTTEGTENYIEGGKLKKISLMDKGDLKGCFAEKSSEWYTTYNNYYGLYTSNELKKVLFAKVKADAEDIAEKNPCSFYKASGAISSDIDLYFEGKGYLKVTSKNGEGIESKGNLELIGGQGDYEINPMNDGLNTTTYEGRNDIVIDVNTLKTIVSLDGKEGDGIDSNGSLIINGGNITAIAFKEQDSGIDSNMGIYINGGNIFATGVMYDAVLSRSKQKFIAVSFIDRVKPDEKITFKDPDDNIIFEYTTDRDFTTLVYSSDELEDGTYHFYKNDILVGYYAKGIPIGPGNRSVTKNRVSEFNTDFEINRIDNLYSSLKES